MSSQDKTHHSIGFWNQLVLIEAEMDTGWRSAYIYPCMYSKGCSGPNMSLVMQVDLDCVQEHPQRHSPRCAPRSFEESKLVATIGKTLSK